MLLNYHHIILLCSGPLVGIGASVGICRVLVGIRVSVGICRDLVGIGVSVGISRVLVGIWVSVGICRVLVGICPLIGICKVLVEIRVQLEFAFLYHGGGSTRAKGPSQGHIKLKAF